MENLQNAESFQRAFLYQSGFDILRNCLVANTLNDIGIDYDAEDPEDVHHNLELTLNSISIPVWDDMNLEQKLIAITDVSKKLLNNEIQLHSNCCTAWEQATAFFLIQYGLETFDPEICFDDMDFMMTDMMIDKGDTKPLKKFAGIDEDFFSSAPPMDNKENLNQAEAFLKSWC